MDLNVRTLELDDFAILQEWWKAWRWPPITKEMLPLNGLGGLMVYNEDMPIAAGFLYLTNSKIAWIEYIISNPKYKKKDRRDSLKLLLNSLEQVAKQQGFTIVFSIGRNKGLMDLHEELGYTIDKTPSHEIIKKIN